MKNLFFVCLIGLVCSLSAQADITHTVFFTLKESVKVSEFKAEAMKLADIPGVKDLQWVRETSPKNEFDYGLTMRFKDQAAYDAYNIHPDHVRFVEKIWIPNVATFLEIDWQADQ
jgi:hypothetical protein